MKFNENPFTYSQVLTRVKLNGHGELIGESLQLSVLKAPKDLSPYLSTKLGICMWKGDKAPRIFNPGTRLYRTLRCVQTPTLRVQK